MKKHSYRQVDVNKVDWSSLRAKTENREIIFSVDVAKKAFVGALATRDKEIVSTLKWEHPQDTRVLVERLINDLGAARLEVVMESSGTYGDVLRWQFIQRGIPVYRVSPKHTHDLAESFDGVPSMHDGKAAHIIAELHLNGRSALWVETAPERRNLRGLVSELEIYQGTHRANLNRLYAQMARHWPELEEVANLDTQSVLTLLKEYGAPMEVAAHKEEALELLRLVGRPGLKEDKCQGILKAAQDTLGVPCTAGERIYIQGLAKDLIRTQKANAEVEKRMRQLVGEHEEMTEVAALCGKTTCIVLIALLGDLRCYPNAHSLLKAIGLNLKERSSGQHKGELRITKRGPGKVRYYLYWTVLRLIRGDPHVKQWYERKVARDGGRSKGRAIMAVMRKVAKSLWYLARGEKFDSHKLFDLREATA